MAAFINPGMHILKEMVPHNSKIKDFKDIV